MAADGSSCEGWSLREWLGLSGCSFTIVISTGQWPREDSTSESASFGPAKIAAPAG
jgi:hypothetical protein